MRDQLPKNAAWSAFGISRAEFPMVAVAVAAGGNVRVGLEDNLYLGKGQLAPSNAALVERAATIIELLDASVATPAEARQIFGLSADGTSLPNGRGAGVRVALSAEDGPPLPSPGRAAAQTRPLPFGRGGAPQAVLHHHRQDERRADERGIELRRDEQDRGDDEQHALPRARCGSASSR